MGALCRAAGTVVGICAQPGDVFTRTPSFPGPSGAAKIVVSAEDSSYDVSRDGKRFLVTVPGQEKATSLATIVVNWTADLKSTR